MEQTKATGNGITEGVIWKQLLVYFFPILLGSFFQQLYNTVDAVIVGQFVGKQALAAVGGATGALVNLLVGFFVGLSSGATVIISQFYGGDRPQDTSRAVHTAIALSLAGGAVFMVLGVALAPVALQAMNTPADVMDYAVTYLRIYFAGIIFNLLYNMGSGILRAVGDSRSPLYFLIVCVVLNVFLDLLFVAVLGMSVAGAALATILSQAISGGLILLRLMRSSDCYRVELKKIRLIPSLFGEIIKIGLPAGLQSVMFNVSNIIIQSSINGFGTNAVAGWTAYSKIDALFWVVNGAYGVSITTFAGQNFGAGKYDRVRKSVRACLVLGFLSALSISGLCLLFGRYVLGIFTNEDAVITQGMKVLRCIAPYYFTHVCMEVMSGAMRGAGDVLWPMVMTCFGICVLRVLWIIFILPLNPVLETLAYSYPISWATGSLLFIVYYLQGGWLRRRIRKRGAPA